MIREFLYKYYIDPIRYGQPYTLVDTLTYALILIAAVYLVYRGLRRYKIAIDDELVLATMPFVVLGGLLRVVEDTGMITSDFRFLLITPLIFFTIFVVAAVALFAGKIAENEGIVARYSQVYGGAGIAACVAAGAALVWFGLTETKIALDVLAAILVLASVTSLALWALLVYGASGSMPRTSSTNSSSSAICWTRARQVTASRSTPSTTSSSTSWART